MRRTQVQIPELLYEEVKRVAKLRDWSISEVFRRAVELLVTELPPVKKPLAWELPEAKSMGSEKISHQEWRDLIVEDEERL